MADALLLIIQHFATRTFLSGLEDGILTNEVYNAADSFIKIKNTKKQPYQVNYDLGQKSLLILLAVDIHYSLFKLSILIQTIHLNSYNSYKYDPKLEKRSMIRRQVLYPELHPIEHHPKTTKNPT